MVQLKSFKSVEQTSSESSPPVLVEESGDQAHAPPSNSSASSSLSMSTVVGGNLTSASDNQSAQSDHEGREAEASGGEMSPGEKAAAAREEEREERTTLSSTEEYQSAVHEIEEEEEEEDVGRRGDGQIGKTGANPEQGKLEDIAKQRASNASQNNESQDGVTRINIERGSITNLGTEPPITGMHKFAGQQIQVQSKQQVPSNQQQQFPPETPRTPRLKLMQRSQTSPTALSQLLSSSGGGGQQQQHGKFTAGSPLVSLARQQFVAGMSPMVSKRVQSSDNMSQFSFSTQKNYNTHFEIRWQNVSLFARQNSRLPKFITDFSAYQYFTRQDGTVPLKAEPMCYSPPVQHKIPPTIKEEGGLEMLASKNNARSLDDPLFSSAISIADKNGHQERSANSNQGRCILNNISGQVFSGQMTAILGPSGVGKSTLLNSLTGRNTLDGSGRVSLIGARERKRMSVVTVPQVDVLPGKLTTMEDLLFTSRLKNAQSKFDHRRNIERIVKHMHMEKFLHTRIDKLSGGEERRLSIARELLASPDIMILDEPTSGLDANTCKKIITALRDIVEHSDNILDKPMSIIVTIHQPQQEVYNLFHRIYVMAVGGRVAYEGPPAMLLPTLLEHSSLAKVAPADQLNENPAIVAIEVASGEYGPEIIEELAIHHEDQVYEEFSILGNFAASQIGDENGLGTTYSPIQTPRLVKNPRRSPLSVSRFEIFHNQHRKRLNSLGNDSIGRPTPILAKRQFSVNQMDKISTITSVSYASTYDAELPEVTTKLKVDKRLRRSVVMKSNLPSHTWTLMQRCWLLATRDMFLMAIRILGYLLVAAGTVQIFANSLDPNEHQCPQYESEVDNVMEYIANIKQRLGGLAPMLNQANATHLFFFHILLCITMVTSALTGLVFPLQMRMFMREYKNGWYSPASFILSQTLAELPVDIVGPLITLLITYPLCNQPTSEYYWREIGYALVIIGCSIICKSQAQIVGAFLMDSVENSVFISCVCVTGPALLSGVPTRISQMVTPLQIISYGSFLRYGFESLLSLRYGYGMCPCDPELIDGYPIEASERAVPQQLNTFARGIIDLNQPINQTTTISDVTTAMSAQSIDQTHDNIILKFIRLVSEASNLMVPHLDDLGDCSKYRSLYLLSMDIPNGILPKWLGIMALMFIISRILTYFVVKTVIKLR